MHTYCCLLIYETMQMTTLSLLVEGSACSWGRLASRSNKDAIADVIRALVSFANSHLSLSSTNKLLLFMYAHGIKERLLFSSRRAASTDHSACMARSLMTSLKQNAHSDDTSMASPLAAVLSHAICHMKRNDDPSAVSATESAAAAGNFIGGRVVIVSMTADFGHEHGPLMNLFFSAAKHGVCVDVISLGETSPLLQQAADITSGVFVRVDEPKRLLSFMMTHVLSDPASRAVFPQPTLKSVDYRASCACHHQLVSTGWVCSVCLSVLCQFMPICSACGAVFKITALPRRALKRKKKD